MIWSKTKEYGKAGWNGVYKLSDKVGYWTNKQGAKVRMTIIIIWLGMLELIDRLLGGDNPV
jgi:hypothetical protein